MKSHKEISAHRDELINALKLVYRKHHMGDDSIGWEEMDSKVHDTLCNVLDENENKRWLYERAQIMEGKHHD